MNANHPKVESAPGDFSRGETPGERIGEEVGRDIEQIRRMGEERLEDLRELGGEVRGRLEEQVRAQPLVALGVAFGAGIVVSSLLSSRLARLAILAAGGYAAREMFGDRLIELLGHDEEEGVPRAPKRERRGGGSGGSSR